MQCFAGRLLGNTPDRTGKKFDDGNYEIKSIKIDRIHAVYFSKKKHRVQITKSCTIVMKTISSVLCFLCKIFMK